ncbi:MAG TPA: MarR family transcriptional regulator [Rhodocyclaceae bacterium]|nr:MarR family transcriptional regulator [Rhodocyclaceae bacterium]
MKKESRSPATVHYDGSNYDPSESIGFLLSRVKLVMVASLDADLESLDITGAQWAVLMRIAHGCGKTAADLCRDGSYDTGSMTRMIDRLEEKGFIHRERSTEDRRVVQLALTDQGEALLPELRKIGAKMLNRHLKDFTAADVQKLKDLLRRMLANGTDSADGA